MTSFRYEPAPEAGLRVVLFLGGEPAGSVTVREHGAGLIAVGQLNTGTGFRGRGVARSLMEHVLWLYGPAEAWLYAEPYVPPGEEPGPPREDLERFYASLGFTRSEKCPELGLMIRPSAVAPRVVSR